MLQSHHIHLSAIEIKLKFFSVRFVRFCGRFVRFYVRFVRRHVRVTIKTLNGHGQNGQKRTVSPLLKYKSCINNINITFSQTFHIKSSLVYYLLADCWPFDTSAITFRNLYVTFTENLKSKLQSMFNSTKHVLQSMFKAYIQSMFKACSILIKDRRWYHGTQM